MAPVLRPDGKPDLRTMRGHRVMFDPETQQEAWYCARLMKRLTPMHQRWVRYLVEALLGVQLNEEAEKVEVTSERHH